MTKKMPPTLLPTKASKRRPPPPGVLFAVYAPFGTDPILSRYPGDQTRTIEQQPLVLALQQVAARGVDVAALVDLHDDDTWLVEIPAFRPHAMKCHSAWKQAMDRPQALAGFLRRAHDRFRCGTLVLALEGHGAGYLPEIDGGRITPATSSQDGGVEWRLGGETSAPFDAVTGAPVLPPFGGLPELPVESPEVHPVTLPLSTWGLAAALASAQKCGVPAPAVIHFNNCFNMALEHLHTVSPYAGYATGYANYNFFTAGETYPHVFQRLADQGSATWEELARWFAAANDDLLSARHNHPTIGGTIALRRMPDVALAVDTLALALVKALQTDRPAALPRIQGAIAGALQYDTEGDYTLDVPDQATDLGSLAAQLQSAFAPGDAVHVAAVAVTAQLKDVWQYGNAGSPHMATGAFWDFGDPRYGMSILLPDPSLTGRWDWRSPYYLAGQADDTQPPAIRAQIPFLAQRPDGSRAPWALFIEEYHRDTKFRGLLRARPLTFPFWEPKAEPGRPKDDTRQVS